MSDRHAATGDLFPRTNRSLPNELVGRWTSGGAFYEFRPDGGYFFGNTSFPYATSSDGQELEIFGKTYHRLDQDGTGIVGLWLTADGSEELRFRPNGTDTIHSSNGETWDGIYEDHGSDITRLEKRAFVIADGPLLTFQPVGGRWEPAAYSVAGDELTLYFSSGVFVWMRV